MHTKSKFLSHLQAINIKQYTEILHLLSKNDATSDTKILKKLCDKAVNRKKAR